LTEKKIYIRKLDSFSSHTIQQIEHVELILAGGSAGSFLPIQELVTSLPKDFPVPVIIILHRGKQFSSGLEELLQNNSTVHITEAKEKEKLLPGNVYIAPADYHLLIERDYTLSLDMSAPVWFCRPSIDVTFESAVDVYQDKIISFLFSGANTDGTQGLLSIMKHGGLTLVQDPQDADFDTMPGDAVEKKAFHYTFRSTEIKSLIAKIYTIRKNVYT
jgi:two-component system chemotaxis response regulator CheB